MSSPIESDSFSPAQLQRYLLRLVAGFVLVFLLVLLAARTYRPELEGWGRGFVDHFGFAGMILGTFLADGFHLPVPPQAYMLLAITSRTPLLPSFLAICLGSLLGGGTAFWLGRRLARLRWLRERLTPLRYLFERAWARFGLRALLLASVTPVPYATICWLAGINRLPPRASHVLALFRIPRLALFFALIHAGWSL